MTRTKHYSHATAAFPVYCLDWTDDATVLMGGGGGASRSGITNKLVRVARDGKLLSLPPHRLLPLFATLGGPLDCC